MLSVYTDGSSHAGGGKPGGWAYYLVRDGVPLACDYGGDPSTTNNIMELKAAVEGLRAAWKEFQPGDSVELVSDSEYVLGTADRAFRTVKNLDLVKALQHGVRIMKVKTRWVPGHSGDTLNDACDLMAKEGKANICGHPRCLRAVGRKPG